MTQTTEADRYILPLPTPSTPVSPSQSALAKGRHTPSLYGETVWWVAAPPDAPTQRDSKFDLGRFPSSLREELRLITWTFLNGELRNSFVRERGTRMRTKVAPVTSKATFRTWVSLANWLHKRGVRTLADFDREALHAFGMHRRDSGAERTQVHHELIAITRLWAFDQLSARQVGVARPPWDEEGADDYLPAASPQGGENKREVLAEETMGPLLIWAIRVVEDLADDILAAHAEFQRMNEAAQAQRGTAATRTALRAFLAPLTAAGGPMPTTRKCGKTALARTYIAAVTGASMNQVQNDYKVHGLARLLAATPGHCPMNTPVTGRITDRPWRDAIDFTEATALLKHLVTAAFIVCSYLTGARPQEVLAMRSGCCRDPETDADGRQRRHLVLIQPEDIADGPGEDTAQEEELKEDDGEPHLLIHSRHFKSATDPDTGNYLPAGVERPVPWVAIAPVVRSIRVLERIVPEGYFLFDSAIHRPSYADRLAGPLGTLAIRERIEEFVEWANAEADAQGLPSQTIAPDPSGKIGTARFRRTLAWHIARRPGGLVALAIQYGHMRTALDVDESGRYGNRSRNGVHGLLDIETALATADAAADLHERFENGEGISGPAARRALLHASTGPVFEGGLVSLVFARKHALARRYLARDGGVLYDNPQALLLCLYKRDRALCRRDDQRDHPTLDRCVPGCGNIVRTDQHAKQMRERAIHLERKAFRLPDPIGDRLRGNAAKLRTWADEHDRTRFTARESLA